MKIVAFTVLALVLTACEVRIDVSGNLPTCTQAHFQHGGVPCVTPAASSPT